MAAGRSGARFWFCSRRLWQRSVAVRIGPGYLMLGCRNGEQPSWDELRVTAVVTWAITTREELPCLSTSSSSTTSG